MFIANVKPFRTIFSFLLVAVFLVPAAGFYYNKHSCSKSGLVQFVLDRDYSCCAKKHEVSESDSDASECPLILEKTEKECCSNEGRYLKTDEDYTYTSKNDISNNKIQFPITLHSVNFFPDSHITVEEQGHSPPLHISSRDILLKNSVFLI